jgi:hypothetical protein
MDQLVGTFEMPKAALVTRLGHLGQGDSYSAAVQEPR